jgi:hypothetical protein
MKINWHRLFGLMLMDYFSDRGFRMELEISFNAEKVRFALEHYDWRMEDGSTVINQLLNKYSLEEIAMPYTMEQFRKEYTH